ncbi:MAG: nicotinate-nucleotide diphosphorylase (carboxylating) [Candidatus Aminicenantes bacterium RBG_19FT_COMBO_58_17]|nr:MAG: nicotinate-nucleotide diphosphorylase (carboxylating) [Candidatus Aminicenantes bacterium RBG_19FT_COMBO_58_17]
MRLRLSDLDPLIDAALKEDIPAGDITSESLISAASRSQAVFLAKEAGVLAGLGVARRVFERIDPGVRFRVLSRDGRTFESGDILAEVRGRSISLLKGERTALNFLQRMSGIATKTRRFVEAVAGTGAQILDTRKTTPTLRRLEKYAVRMGGGENHRASLSDMVLIKDNHLALVGSISEAVRRAREKSGRGTKIEVEVADFAAAKETVAAGADRVMLDNMPLNMMRPIVRWLKGRIQVEVSGKVTLGRARQIAEMGVEYISVGGLTHSFGSVDISLEFRKGLPDA